MELRDIWGCLDLTMLGAGDSERSVGEFAGRVARLAIERSELPQVAAVCVWPRFVDTAALALGASRVAIASVAGGFPAGQTFLEVKMLEAAMAVENGADEIDLVIDIGGVLEGDDERVQGEVEMLRGELPDVVLKVILETGLLEKPEIIARATTIAMRAGADFVKTSTGKHAIGATVMAVETMCVAVKRYYQETGRQVGVKVAGGVRTVEEAVEYAAIVERVLGKEWLTPRLFRIGASVGPGSLPEQILARM